MTIDDIDFAQLYRDHLAQAERTRKDPRRRIAESKVGKNAHNTDNLPPIRT